MRPAEAIRLGDRIAVMRAGRLVQAGKAEALYRNPADLFVARLFSEINEIPLQVEGGALRTPIGVFAVPGLDEGDAAILCIRRRAIRLGPAGQGLPGRVLHARFLGDLAVLEIAAQGFERPLQTLVREWEVPQRGRGGVDRRRSRERAGVPGRGARGDDGKLMPEAPEMPEIQAFRTLTLRTVWQTCPRGRFLR